MPAIERKWATCQQRTQFTQRAKFLTNTSINYVLCLWMPRFSSPPPQWVSEKIVRFYSQEMSIGRNEPIRYLWKLSAWQVARKMRVKAWFGFSSDISELNRQAKTMFVQKFEFLLTLFRLSAACSSFKLSGAIRVCARAYKHMSEEGTSRRAGASNRSRANPLNWPTWLPIDRLDIIISHKASLSNSLPTLETYAIFR